MKKTLSFLVLATMLLVVASCDKIDNPIKPYTPTGGGKTVLIKDFTGARCVNCPGAAEAAHNLQHQLGENRVFIMSVHAGALATPVGSFPDFVTEEGTAWYGGSQSNPLFTVDHVGLTSGNTLYVEQIDTPVSEGLLETQTFDISILNEYDATTRKLTVKSEATAVSEYFGQLYMTVCLLEDSLVGRQIVPGGLDTAYVFRNVFRGTLNGADGEALVNGQVYVDDQLVRNASIVLDDDYNADQCYIMTYVYDKALNGKILQTAMEKVK